MDEEYDYVVLGTGLTECIMSGLLSVEGKKVLHMDRNDYYGADCASLNLTQLYKKYKNKEPPENIGRDRDYAVDQIPKFSMASGEFVKILLYTDVTRYLEFKQIGASYVYRDGRIAKVPSNETEALTSPLMGLMEKRRAKRFFEFLGHYKQEDPQTHMSSDGALWGAITRKLDLQVTPMKDVYAHFGLEPGTQDFIGHALALNLDDGYKERAAFETYEKIILYNSSLARYGKSPYIYPMYGLGDLPQAFARLAAIYGGTYMLSRDAQEFKFDESGRVCGVVSNGETVKCKGVICDPSYAKDRVKTTERVIRATCLLKAPIPNTADADSLQLIIPQNQVGRKHDIYVAMVGYEHRVCAKGYFVAIVSTIVETDNPGKEIHPALQLLGPIEEIFASVYPLDVPTNDPSKDGIYISPSYDATSHFETVCDDVKRLYEQVMGKPLDFTGKIKRADGEEEEAQLNEAQ